MLYNFRSSLVCCQRSICLVLRKEKRKRDEQFIESQRGAIHKFFPASNNARVDGTEVHGLDLDQGQELDHNLNSEVDVNDNEDATGEQNLNEDSAEE